MVLQFLTYGTTYAAVEHTTVAGKELFNFLQLQKQRKELVVHNKQQFINQEAVFEIVQAQKHVFLLVNNQQVLVKKVDSYEENQLQLVQKAFPNITLNDFYYETYTNNESSFVAICRKNYIDELIATYEKNQIAIIGFSLGNLAIQNLLPFIEQDSRLYTSNAQIMVDENGIQDIVKEETQENYTINGLVLSTNDILPLSGILQYYLQSETLQTGVQEKYNELQTTYQQKQFFSVGLKSVLGLLLVALLVNFVFFNRYHSKINQLEGVLTINESKKQRIVQLKNAIARKKGVVASINSVLQSKISWYLDEVSQLVPNTILLHDMEYQPLKSRIKVDKPITYFSTQLVIKGASKNAADFTNWITELEKKEWIHKVTIKNYGKGRKQLTDFEFLIALKGE